MQRILNNPDNIVEEMLEGFLKAHPDLVEATDNPRAVKSVYPTQGRVAVVTGGGSGHKPAFIGFCGENLCDGIAVGEICSSPTAKAFLDTFTAVDGGKGVACLYGNYSGDNMNVKMAVKMAKKQGLTVKTVVCNDDVASAPFAEREKRRGIAAEMIMYKCGGAMAATGADLDEVIRVAQKSVDWSRSAGIGLTPCTLPAVGHPNFEIKEGETTPPSRYNSGTIILAMENAGKLIEDEELREQIKGAGIGTSATRAGIIEKLERIKYIDINKKTQIITPTTKGEAIYDIIAKSIPDMLNPDLTASWEKGLDMVAKKEIEPDIFMGKLEKYIRSKIDKLVVKY